MNIFRETKICHYNHYNLHEIIQSISRRHKGESYYTQEDVGDIAALDADSKYKFLFIRNSELNLS